ncbi:helix-turn-helix domain-containing protein [Xanthobacter agilis]|uniref:helix-turn-helix domain-containing protein n=1 Tax=Xanthobacter agilis TaxID=47492 RepID=UPI00372C3A0C
MPTDDQTPSGSRGSDSTFELQGRFLPGDMVNGRLIASARALLGWDQRELAERAGIRRHTLAALEGDVRKAQTRVRQAVLQILENEGIRFVVMAGAFGVMIEAGSGKLPGSNEPYQG